MKIEFKKIISQKSFIIFLIVAAGLFLRWLYPMDRMFDFDQNQIATFAKQILNKDLTLIGPQTGPARFFTGPLIYYLGAIIYWLTGLHPVANTYLGLTIYLSTVIALILILRNRFSSILTIFLAIYSLSPFFVFIDRTTWNPNFSFLSSSLVFFSLLNFNKEKPLLSYLLGFLGAFLAYQAHFSGFIVLGIAVILSVFINRSIKLATALFFGLIFSLIPLVIFDMRNHWLNFYGLISLFTDKERMGSVDLFVRANHNLLIILENIGKIFLQGLPFISLITIGLFILFIFSRLKNTKLIPQQFIIVWVWIFSPLIFSFYRLGVPEYYFLIQFPALVLIISFILKEFSEKPILILIIGGLFFSVSLGMVQQSLEKQGLTLKNKIAALEFIKKQSQDNPINLVYDMDLGNQFGWNYLIDYLNLKIDNSLPIKTHLIYPTNQFTIASFESGKLGIWFDKRTNINQIDYFEGQKGILVYYPDNWIVISDLEVKYYPQDKGIKVNAFSSAYPFIPSETIYTFYFSQKEELKYLESIDDNNPYYNNKGWFPAKISNTFFKDKIAFRRIVASKYILVVIFPSDFSQEKIDSFLNLTETAN